ncbi:MAG: hypothetical protein H6744_03880 [Deltaproteobacteria bacterium]|nr:hypothetical protein [Deltaproteobacteria bacterium]MCB9785817.1 hypothetical protein [Deltaproteobacteria bacterium]
MDEGTVKELDDQIALCNQRFKQVVEQIRAVLAEDIPSFVSREAKRRFLARTEVAERLSDEQVKELKRRATEEGARAGERILAALADDDLWAQGHAEPDDTRSLVGADAVWEVIRTVEGDARTLLSDFGLDDADRPIYKSPTWFVKGLYLPTLVEHYWKLLGELAALRNRKQEVAAESKRLRLTTRWDEA